MYTNVAYLHDTLSAIVDESKPLIVTSCGYYRLQNRPLLETKRPFGRADYQLVYIAEGKAHFYFDGVERVISKGNMVLFRPNEPQRYEYYGEEQTEAYWVHFTGKDVESILNAHALTNELRVFFTGTSAEYQWLFNQMIRELQLCRVNYENLLSVLLQHIFLLINRYLREENKAETEILNEIEYATHFFNENYNRPINVEEYAKSRHMSACWFIRRFKQIVKMTPAQYIISLRLTNAKTLLGAKNYNVTETAYAVGYDNPLYFCRLFKKHVGVTPSEYKKQQN